MSICRMGESGLVTHAQCAVFGYHRGRGTGFFQDRAHVLVYMESYCISVVCKELLCLRLKFSLKHPVS